MGAIDHEPESGIFRKREDFFFRCLEAILDIWSPGVLLKNKGKI